MYKKITAANAPRVELHDQLGLTGCELSINTLPAGVALPFVHAHKQNEELYGILAGKGEMSLDGEIVPVAQGDWVKVTPEVKRSIRATTEALTYICIQTKTGSLEGYTMTDGVMVEAKAAWE
jgi:mannose-6-phosphate isomerase-like protein (cupin superfamily)